MARARYSSRTLEDFSHGLNERTPVANIPPTIDYYLSVVQALSR